MKEGRNKKQSHQRKAPIVPRTSPDRNPFKTPANYFAELPDEIQYRLKAEVSSATTFKFEEVIKRWVVSLIAPKPAFALLTILILAGVYLSRDHRISEQNLYTLSPEEISEYLEENIDELDLRDFYLIDPESLDPLSSSMDPEDLDVYLDELIEDIDLEMIEEVF